MTYATLATISGETNTATHATTKRTVSTDERLLPPVCERVSSSERATETVPGMVKNISGTSSTSWNSSSGTNSLLKFRL